MTDQTAQHPAAPETERQFRDPVTGDVGPAHDPVCAALSHDDEDSCSCGVHDDAPAAPETDVSALTEAECNRLANFLEFYSRGAESISGLVEEVAGIVAKRMRVVEGERDRARLSRDAAKNATARQIRARKSAEADRDALRAGIEALAAGYETTYLPEGDLWPAGVVANLRALARGDS